MMKFKRISVASALCAVAALSACSSDTPPSEQSSAVGFKLTTAEGVIITSVDYDLNTQAGANVVDGSIPVPNPDSTISLGIDSLAAGNYSLAFSASGTRGTQTFSCISSPSLFTLAAQQVLTLPPVTLTCTTTVPSTDNTGHVNADVNVVVETITVDNNIVETFAYGPRAVRGVSSGGTCTFPPISLKIANNDPTIGYSWAASPDGTFTGTSTNGAYTCASGGSKVLTLSAVRGSVNASKSVTVTCDDSACGGGTGGTGGAGTGGTAGEATGGTAGSGTGGTAGEATGGTAGSGTGGTAGEATGGTAGGGTAGTGGDPCGNGVIDSGEQCDEATTRCTACQITPVCGDGIVDGPTACAGGVSDPDCTEECDTAGPTATCTATCEIPEEELCSDTWLECIAANAELGPVQTEFCNDLCVAAERCVIDNGCFSPNAAACYCGFGVDVDLCATGSFVPNLDPTSPSYAPCYNEIRAGENNPATNQEALDRFFDFEYATGVGMQIVDASQASCAISCAD
jgi:hypothetical protein